MKINSSAGRPKATHIFTDREEPRASFWKAYNNLEELIKKGPDNKELTVLSYYGVGGIGKTKLLQKLLKELLDNNRKAIYFDFSTEKDHLLVLESIKNRLYKDYGFKFTLFETGLYVYANKIGQIREMPQKETFLARYPALDAAVEILGAVPTANVVSQFVKALDKGVAWFRNSKDKYEALLRELESQEPQELYDDLTKLFCLDMNKNLKDKKIKEPFVIMLDTYEEFVGEGASESDSIKNESWINGPEGLIQKIPNVLWVIAGRNNLKWGEEWREPDENGWISLDEHIIEGLSEPDAISFLKETGISNEELCKKLYVLTEGLPVYLDLCVDRYYEIKGRGQVPSFDKFGKNIETLVARFAKNLDHNTKELVYILSCLRIWNDEMIQEIVPQVFKGFTVSLYEKIKDFSFIVKSDEATLNFHQTVADILYKKCPDLLKESTKTNALEFLEKKFETIEVFSGEYVFYTRWLAQYAVRSVKDDQELLEFFALYIEDPLGELSRSGQFDAAYGIFKYFFYREEKSDNDKYVVYILNAFSEFLSHAGQYNDAYDTIMDAIDLAEESIKIDEDTNVDFADTMFRIYQNRARYLFDLGDYQAAYERLKRLYKIHIEDREEDEYNNVTLSLMDDLARTLDSLCRYNEALELWEKELELSKKILGEKDWTTIVSMDHLATSLSNLERYNEALDFRKKALELSREVLGEKHPHTISTMGNLAADLAYLGQYNEALDLWEKVLELNKEVLGVIHPNTILGMINQGNTLLRSGQCYKAIEPLKEALELSREVLGEKHPLTIICTNNLAADLAYLGQYNEVLDLREKALKLSKEVLGEKHPDTVLAMNGLAWAYFLNKKYQEGLPYAETAVALQDENTDITEKQKVETLDTLALLYAETGMNNKALDIASSNLEIALYKYASDITGLASRYYAMAYCLNKVQRYQDALPCAEKAYEIRKVQIGEEKADTVKAKELLDEIKDNLSFM